MTHKKFVIPSFDSEQAEAAWWYKNRPAAAADLRSAIREGRSMTLQEALKRAARKEASVPVTIRLPREDVAVAKVLAAQDGIGYQTFIKIILRRALRGIEAEAGKAVSGGNLPKDKPARTRSHVRKP